MVRLTSAIVLLAIIVTTIWVLPPVATIVLAAVAAALAAGEVAVMAGRVGATIPVPFVSAASALVTVAFVMSVNGDEASGGAPLVALLLALVVTSGVITLTLGAPGSNTLTRAAVMTMAPLYVGLPLGVFASVQGTHGPAATTWLLAIIAVSDSAQYYTGRMFGRRKLAPTISPAKTVEGAVGGLVIAGLAGVLLGPLCLPAMPAAGSAALAVGLALFGITGDLFESLIKRSAGMKDSSALIPGHGGVLDRIDSHLFAAPVFYLVTRYL